MSLFNVKRWQATVQPFKCLQKLLTRFNYVTTKFDWFCICFFPKSEKRLTGFNTYIDHYLIAYGKLHKEEETLSFHPLSFPPSLRLAHNVPTADHMHKPRL